MVLWVGLETENMCFGRKHYTEVGGLSSLEGDREEAKRLLTFAFCSPTVGAVEETGTGGFDSIALGLSRAVATR